tara:strand:+ start:790 stop:1125 length:336 start_codon:yes stop_codon:yes gene_type:complete
MSDFFDSEIVQEEVKCVMKMQEDLYRALPGFYMMDKDEKINVIAMLEKLLEKQQILYTRLSLSQDPKAIELKKDFDKQKVMLGIPENVSAVQVFDEMKQMIDTYMDNIDRE